MRIVDIDRLLFLLPLLHFLHLLHHDLTEILIGIIKQAFRFALGRSQQIQAGEELYHLTSHHRRTTHSFPPREGAVVVLEFL